MLNKKDPLIGAVQQVMQQSNAEREATRIVNERFGIESRKSLPHEYQAHWDSEYQQVLSESNIDHPNKRKLDVAPPYGELTKKDFSTLRAMGEDLEAIQEEIAYNLAEQAEYVYENYGEEGLVEFFESLTEEQLEILSLYESNFWKDTNIGRGMAAAGKWLSGSGGGSGDGYSGAKETYKNTTPGGAWAGTTNTNATAKKDLGIAGVPGGASRTGGALAPAGTKPTNTATPPSPATTNTATPPAAAKDASTNKATPPAAKSTNTATPPAVKKIKRVVPSDIGSGGKQERGSSLGVTTGTTTGKTATNRPLSKTMRDNPVASFRAAPRATAKVAMRNPNAAKNALSAKGVSRAAAARGVQNARNGTGSFSGGRNRGGGMGGGMGGRGGRGGGGRGGGGNGGRGGGNGGRR